METKKQAAIDSKQYLTFMLDREMFAFEVLKVKEVLEVAKITKVPRTPDFMPGVSNLRGSVVPGGDLRLKFEITAKDRTGDTAIIIV